MQPIADRLPNVSSGRQLDIHTPNNNLDTPPADFPFPQPSHRLWQVFPSHSRLDSCSLWSVVFCKAECAISCSESPCQKRIRTWRYA